MTYRPMISESKESRDDTDGDSSGSEESIQLLLELDALPNAAALGPTDKMKRCHCQVPDCRACDGHLHEGPTTRNQQKLCGHHANRCRDCVEANLPQRLGPRPPRRHDDIPNTLCHTCFRNLDKTRFFTQSHRRTHKRNTGTRCCNCCRSLCLRDGCCDEASALFAPGQEEEKAAYDNHDAKNSWLSSYCCVG